MESKSFDARVRSSASIPVIDLHGEIDAAAGPALGEAFAQVAAAHPGVVLLTFGGVGYINSTGIAHIIGLLAKAREAGIEMRACGLSDHYTEIFEITRVSDFMKLFVDEASALQDVPAT